MQDQNTATPKPEIKKTEPQKAENNQSEKKQEKSSLWNRILTISGIVLCVLLVPILIMNCTLLIKGAINKDEVPSFGSYLPLIILTDSMEDEFPSGSLIFCRALYAEEVKKDDIIAFFDPASTSKSIVTHKVIDIKYDESGAVESFTTKGTANNAQDRLPVPAENLVARYTGFHIKGAGNVALFMQTTPGFILCVFVPLILLLAYDIIRRKLYEKKHEGDKDELLRELQELRELKTQAMAVVAKSETMRPTSPAAPAPVKTPTPVKKPAPVQKKTKELTEADFEIEDT